MTAPPSATGAAAPPSASGTAARPSASGTAARPSASGTAALAAPTRRWVHPALLASVFVIATSGLVYELVAGTLASYVLGDSVTQFSLVIGIYLFAMGIGSYASRFLESDLLARFVEIELGVALAGGFSSMLLFRVYASGGAFKPMLYLSIGVIGVLVGLEIPLLIRILKFSLDLKDLVARVLGLDYIGALVASLMFPAVLVPRLGLHQTSLLFGFLNAAVAMTTTFLVPLPAAKLWRLRTMALAVMLAIALGSIFAGRFIERTEALYFGAPIVYSAQSPYQRLVITQTPRVTRLWLNGNLQFSSDDEHRYHQVLVHPAVAALGRAPRTALVLGGGDGLATRELLRYPSLEQVTLVDLDPAMTEAFATLPLATRLNGGALADPRVTVVNDDAFLWLDRSEGSFDVVIVDFPDPANYAVGKLYTDAFYQLLRRKVGVRGVAMVQATSPQYARESFWTIVTTLEDAGFVTAPLHVYVPSFGDWGFVLCGGQGFAAPASLRPEASDLSFLEAGMLPELFRFPRDIGRVEAPVNRLNEQKLVTIYTREWAAWGR